MSNSLDWIKYLLMGVTIGIVILFLYLISPRPRTIDPNDPEAALTTVAPSGFFMFRRRQFSDMDAHIAQRDAIRATELRIAAALAESASHPLSEEDTIDPLPKYSLYGRNTGTDSHVHLDLQGVGSGLEINELDDGAVIITSARAVLASAGTPLLPPPPRVAAGSWFTMRRDSAVLPTSPLSSAPSSPGTSIRESSTVSLLFDPAHPGLVPDAAATPLVRLSLTLPPPPKYDT